MTTTPTPRAQRTRKAAPRARAKPAPKTLSQVVAEGDRRASLVALRDRLAKELEGEPRDIPALARQLSLVLRELDDMPLPKGSAVDDLSARRADRRAKAAGQ